MSNGRLIVRVCSSYIQQDWGAICPTAKHKLSRERESVSLILWEVTGIDREEIVWANTKNYQECATGSLLEDSMSCWVWGQSRVLSGGISCIMRRIALAEAGTSGFLFEESQSICSSSTNCLLHPKLKALVKPSLENHLVLSCLVSICLVKDIFRMSANNSIQKVLPCFLSSMMAYI